VKAVERVGGLINASTGREVTYFYIRISARRLELALDVLTDLVFNPAFDSGSIELEKGVILEEMRMSEDDPGQALYDRFLLATYGNCTYGRPILGSEKNVVSFNRRALLDYHKKHYSHSNLIASIAGGIDPDRVQSLLEKKLGQFPVGKKEKITTGRPPEFRRTVKVYSKDVEQTALILGFPSASVLSPERYAYSLLDAITAGGMMSRLFQEVREKRGLVYSIDSTHQPFRNGGLFTIEAGMREENLLTVLKIILRELGRLSKQGPGPRELQDTKVYLRGHWALGLESTSARMIRNAMSVLFFDRLIPHEEVVEKLTAVTVEDVAHVSGRAFEKDGPAIAVMSRFDNGNKLDSVTDKIEAIKKSSMENNFNKKRV
ncbi:MAG TPA: insulinase family protein, partial [Firmicutes bacterium]|nr:insulinase family protein [Bacillota bacterium]